MVNSISFQTFLYSIIVIDSWKFIILLLYILWDDWPISNEQLQQQLEYTLLNPDCHSRWFSKMQSGHENTLEEQYAIKLCFKLGKMPQKHMECFRLLFDHLAWIKLQFLSGIRDSRKAGSLWGMMRGVSGISTRTMHQFTTPSLSQTIWPRLALRQFLSLSIVQTLFPVTFCYSLSSEDVVMR